MVNAMQIKRVLGITMGACSSAALFVDGKIVACVSEERLVRKKNYSGYPKGAVELCLEYGKVLPESLDFIALVSGNVDPDYIVTQKEYDEKARFISANVQQIDLELRAVKWKLFF